MTFFNKPLIMSSAFSTACFIDRMLQGRGGHWIDYVERFMERKKRQNVDGIRVFGETTFWDGDKFFNKHRATSGRMWDHQALSRQDRPERLTAHNQLLILKLMTLAQKHDLKVEYVTDATLKHSNRNIGWDVIGHCIRETAYFFQCVDKGRWDPDHCGVPGNGDLSDRIHKRFIAVHPPIRNWWIHETHNEWDAHSYSAWKVSGYDRAGALNEVNKQLHRHHTKEDHWPLGIVGVSHGGKDNVDYQIGAPTGADYIAVHPERSDDWWRVGDRFKHLEGRNAPIYMNETKHFIDPSMWWTVENGWFSYTGSTKDVEKIIQFEQDCLAKGYSFCRHDLVGMANGMWESGGEFTEMELDAREKAMEGITPPPPENYRYKRVIDLGYQQILGRAVDLSGLEHYDAQMTSGMTEAEMRESLLRSEEYKSKNLG